MKPRVQSSHVTIALLIITVVGLAIYMQRQAQPEIPWPRAAYNDGTPLGGKGYRLLLQWLGYKVDRVDRRLAKMPADARVWLVLDYRTTFSRTELDMLLQWVKEGGTLIWAASSPHWNSFGFPTNAPPDNNLAEALEKKFKLSPGNGIDFSGKKLPPLSPLVPGAAANYWADVKKASTSSGTLNSSGGPLEIAGTLQCAQLVRIDYGKGRIFAAADPTMFTNYGLNDNDTAVLASNLVRVHVPQQSSAGVYFDERRHGDDTPVGAKDVEKGLWYYLWQPPLRYALLQLMFAGVWCRLRRGLRYAWPVFVIFDQRESLLKIYSICCVSSKRSFSSSSGVRALKQPRRF